MTIARAVWDIAAFNKRDAEELTDQTVEDLIQVFMRDPALPYFSYPEWSIKLAEVRQRVTAHIHRRINGHLDRQDVLNVLGEDAHD